MACITIRQTCDICGNAICPPRTYLIQNMKSVSINQRTNNQVIPIPQLPADPCSPKGGACQGTIVIKTEGNVTNIDVAWTVHDSMCVDLSSGSAMCTINTVAEQLDYVLCCFENVGIQEKYTIQIGCCYGPKKVKPQNVNFSKTEDTPITWQGTWSFVIGDIRTTTCEG